MIKTSPTAYHCEISEADMDFDILTIKLFCTDMLNSLAFPILRAILSLQVQL